ncbi:MAG: hypothetical protein HYU36_21285 [Planctomycetes bacterium]|nr:hypothetical protein [Planctomycetota bacterium]
MGHFPEENFLVYGIPDRWHPVGTVTVSVDVDAPEVFLAAVRLQRRKRMKGPRLTDRGLLAQLALDGLPAVRRAAGSGDTDRALRALAWHFRRRRTPEHFYGRPRDAAAAFSPSAADDICAHRILGQQLTRRLDWRANPIGYLEWMHAFNRHYFTMTLIDAYKATGHEKYAAKLDALYSSWMEQNPEPQDTNGGGDPAWETPSTAGRIYGSWLEAWFTLQRSPSFRHETRVAMLKSFSCR